MDLANKPFKCSIKAIYDGGSNSINVCGGLRRNGPGIGERSLGFFCEGSVSVEVLGNRRDWVWSSKNAIQEGFLVHI